MSSNPAKLDIACKGKEHGASTSEGSLEVKDPFRKAMPTLDAEEDVCSICLDEFSEEDPGIGTACGHSYHLQCIMQWAQRSRECPLCFKSLKLKDPDLHAMLPFGEYVSHDRQCPTYGGMGEWELESILQRLALQNYNGGPHRRSRARHHSRQNAAVPPLSSAVPASAGRSSSIAIPQSTPREERSGGSLDFPGSWPPRAYPGREGRNEQNATPTMGSTVSSDLKTAGESLKSRWSSFQARCRESFSGRSSGVAK